MPAGFGRHFTRILCGKPTETPENPLSVTAVVVGATALALGAFLLGGDGKESSKLDGTQQRDWSQKHPDVKGAETLPVATARRLREQELEAAEVAIRQRLDEADARRAHYMATTVEVKAEALRSKLDAFEKDESRQNAAVANERALRSRLERVEVERAQKNSVAEAKAGELRLRLERKEADRARHAKGEANAEALRLRLERKEADLARHAKGEANAEALRARLERAEADSMRRAAAAEEKVEALRRKLV